MADPEIGAGHGVQHVGEILAAHFRRRAGKNLRRIDDRTLEFKLRDDVVFHDGTKFSADDVVYTLNWVIDPKSKVRYADTWFGLGDADLATHLFRTQQLRQGQRLSQVTAAIARAWGVQAVLLPMSNDPVRTVVHTEAGALPFQEYFVKRRGEGRVTEVELRGIAAAAPAPGVCEAIRTAQLVILPPSNPIVSIGPILALPGVREALRETAAPVVAISPLVAGKPV